MADINFLILSSIEARVIHDRLGSKVQYRDFNFLPYHRTVVGFLEEKTHPFSPDVVILTTEQAADLLSTFIEKYNG